MNTLDFIKSKIYYFNNPDSFTDFKRKLAFWQFCNYKIVFTNGCFDIIHLGHIDYLSKSADLGKILIIGLNTDMSVKKIKGNSRPVNNENARAVLLASLSFVDAVVLFDEENPYELIKAVNPEILVKGADYQKEKIIGNDIIKENGGEVITISFLEGFSTSDIIEKIKLI